MKLHSLSDLYLHELREAYDASEQVLLITKRLVTAASNSNLVDAIEARNGIARQQVRRLEAISADLGQTARGGTSEGMAGLGAEAHNRANSDAETDVMDAALVGVCQRIEHYFIALFGTLRTYARLLRRFDDAALLCECLDEAKQADERLTQIADGFVNTRALA